MATSSLHKIHLIDIPLCYIYTYVHIYITINRHTRNNIPHEDQQPQPQPPQPHIYERNRVYMCLMHPPTPEELHVRSANTFFRHADTTQSIDRLTISSSIDISLSSSMSIDRYHHHHHQRAKRINTHRRVISYWMIFNGSKRNFMLLALLRRHGGPQGIFTRPHTSDVTRRFGSINNIFVMVVWLHGFPFIAF
jgi:hypothetical protein